MIVIQHTPTAFENHTQPPQRTHTYKRVTGERANTSASYITA